MSSVSSSSGSEAELRCSVCTSWFSDPVTLSCCGHSLCRRCVLPEAACPQCGAALPPERDLELLPTSQLLLRLVQRAQERPERRASPGEEEEPWLCPEHVERLKLFCVTDQKLACIICRDGEAHDGHRFKPIREAAAGLRRDIDLGLDHIKNQMEEIEKLTESQSEEIKKSKELSSRLKTQVQEQFRSMKQFLSRREEEILKELSLKEEDTVENMSHSLNAMKRALTECEERRESWSQVLQVTDPEKFLRRWSEDCGSVAKNPLLGSWSEGLAVVPSPLFQGPYQSHLQFFIWKEMLQQVKPKAELLRLREDNHQLTVSADKRSFHCAPQTRQESAFSRGYGGSLFDPQPNVYGTAQNFTHFVPPSLAVSSSDEFSSGQHYWEVEVGLRDFWCVGIQHYFLKYENRKYFECEGIGSTELELGESMEKLGVYLNCSSKTLSFYDADTMTRLHKVCCSDLTLPVSAYFSVRHQQPDRYPVTVCRY